MRALVNKTGKESLKQCFTTIKQLLELDVVELWTKGQNGFGMHYVYRGEKNIDCNRSDSNDEESKNLCEKSMESQDGFFYTDSKNCLVKDESRFKSRICFHLPRDNVNTDVFIVGYSVEPKQVIMHEDKFSDIFSCLRG